MTLASISQRLDGKTVVLTGASDGIGKAAARAYAALGASVVMVGRNEAKTAAAARAIMNETGRQSVSWEIADLSVQQDVQALAARLLHRCPRIDVLANNAGSLFLDRVVTADGIEQTFALNHLNYFALTLRLLPALYAAATPGAPARVICVSSRAHEGAKPLLHDLQLAARYGGWTQYANSKLYNIWFTRSLARRVDPARLVVQAMHPGVVSTRFAVNNGTMGRVLRGLMDVISVTPERGADTLVFLSAANEALQQPGDYWVKRRRIVPSKTARDDGRGEQLWRESERLTGLDADAMIRTAEAYAVA
jgi:retinol dehydrogenase-12